FFPGALIEFFHFLIVGEASMFQLTSFRIFDLRDLGIGFHFLASDGLLGLSPKGSQFLLPSGLYHVGFFVKMVPQLLNLLFSLPLNSSLFAIQLFFGFGNDLLA